MSSQNTRSFESMVPRVTVDVKYVDADGVDGVVSITLRSIGHIRIAECAFEHPIAKEIIEVLLASLDNPNVTASKDAASIIEAFRDIASGKSLSIGDLAARFAREFPRLAAYFIVSSTELRDGESVDDYRDFVIALDIDEFLKLFSVWVGLHFRRGLSPFVEAARIVGLRIRPVAAAA